MRGIYDWKVWMLGLVLIVAAVGGSASTVSETGSLPDAAEVLQRYIAAVGGRTAIESLATRVCVGRMIDDLAWKVPTRQVTPFVAYGAVPGHVLMVEHGSRGVRCEGSDGDVVWVQEAGGVRLKLEGPFSIKTAWLIDPQGPLRMHEYFPELRVVGEQTIGERRAYILGSPGLDPAYYALAFDVETGLLCGIGYYWLVEDYRKVDGITIPHRVSLSRKGGSTTLVFDLIDHNLPLEEKLFVMPDTGPEPQE
jgi:hypothetical protein